MLKSARGPGTPARAFLLVRRGGADVGQRRLAISLLREIAERNDTDRLAVVDDRQAPQRLLTHDLHRVSDPTVGRECGDVFACDLAELHLLWVLSFGEGSHDDVAIRDDA